MPRVDWLRFLGGGFGRLGRGQDRDVESVVKYSDLVQCSTAREEAYTGGKE